MLPDWLKAESQTEDFWSTYNEFGGGRREPAEEAKCRFNVGAGLALQLCLDEYLSCPQLELIRGGESFRLGWDDAAHWFPHVLRWEELDLVGRCAALHDARLPHPGVPLLLLARFTPICVGDDVSAVLPLLDSAWRQVPAVRPEAATSHIESLDHRSHGFVWSETDRGHMIDQDEATRRAQRFDLYSLRRNGSEDFPFEAMEQLRTSARQTIASTFGPWLEGDRGGEVARLAEVAFTEADLTILPELHTALEQSGCTNSTVLDACAAGADPVAAAWVIESIVGGDPGALIRRGVGGTTRVIRTPHSLELVLPGPSSPDWRVWGLDERLRDLGIGSASPSTSLSRDRGDGVIEVVESQASIKVRGDLGAAVAVIREVLEGEVPEGTALFELRGDQDRRSVDL